MSKPALRRLGALIGKIVPEAEQHRAYLYRVALVVGGLLVASGRITDGQLSTVLTVVGAVLGLSGSGMAAVKTSTASTPAKKPVRRRAPRKPAA
jgi:hypothetical protein